MMLTVPIEPRSLSKTGASRPNLALRAKFRNYVLMVLTNIFISSFQAVVAAPARRRPASAAGPGPGGSSQTSRDCRSR